MCMKIRIEDFRRKQVVSLKNGAVLGVVADVELNTESGKIDAVIIPGRSRFFGILGRDEDIVISWEEIDVIGNETVLVTTEPPLFTKNSSRGIFRLR